MACWRGREELEQRFKVNEDIAVKALLRTCMVCMYNAGSPILVLGLQKQPMPLNSKTKTKTTHDRMI